MTNSMSAIIKFINGKNDKRDYLSGAIDYVTDATKTNGGALVATQGCSRSHILDDILVNKVLHHKPHGKQGVHFVLAFPPEGNAKSSADILNVTREIVSTVYPDYLAIMAVHIDSRVLHSHVILDAVNAVTGKKLSQGPGDLNRVKQKVNGILKANGFEIIRMSTNEFVDYTNHSSEDGFDFLELEEADFLPDTGSVLASTDSVYPCDVFLTGEELHGITGRLRNITEHPTRHFGGELKMDPNNYTPIMPQQDAHPTISQIPNYANPSSSLPTTAVIIGPTFRIRGSEKSDFNGLAELTVQATKFAHEHQDDAARLAFSMQTKAQENGLLTNMAVIAGPVFDIDLCGGDNSPQHYYRDDGEVYYK